MNDDDDDEDIGNAFDESGKFIKKEPKKNRKSPSPNTKDDTTVQAKNSDKKSPSPTLPITVTPTAAPITPAPVPQKPQQEIDKNIKKLLIPPVVASAPVTTTISSQNIEIIETKTNPVVKETINNLETNNIENNIDNKNNNLMIKENFINQGPIDQALLNSLLNTSKLTPQAPEPQLLNPKDPLIGYNQLNSLSQFLNTNPSPPIPTTQHQQQPNLQAQLLAQALLAQQQQQQQQQQHQLHHNNLKLNNENNDAKKGPVSLNHPDADKWLYLDPQNQIQGTFTSEEMAAWFAAGYFTLNLMIKRGCDDQFLPLGIFYALIFRTFK